MLVQAKHRCTVKDYYRMAETRVLAPDARVELLDGEITDIPPMEPLHGGVSKFLTWFFTSTGNDRWITSVQNPVRLSDYSEPQPDLMLLKSSPDFYRRQHPRPEDVYLLVEVSDSTLESDQEQKLPAYARAAIAEVWIVDLNDESIQIYREPSFTGYAAKTVLRAGDQAVPQAFPDAVVDLAELLKR
jgi:Uma2 family endonuclease